MPAYLVSGESPTKLKNLCRMCASSCQKPVKIFGPEGVANELAVKICSYLPVKVSEVDTLPQQLCYNCTNLLIQWDAAVVVAVASDKKLRALQWQEEQCHNFEGKNLPSPEENNRCSDSMDVTGESLSCSICNKSGMVFRELVDHLKSHKKSTPLIEDQDVSFVEKSPRQLTPRCKRKSAIESINQEDSTSEHNEEVVQQIVHLETLDQSRNSRPRRQVTLKRLNMSETSSPSKSGDGKRRFRIKKHKHKPVQSSEIEDMPPLMLDSPDQSLDDTLKSNNGTPKDPSGPVPFKAKVRIISAESINQSLEERAKINQSAKTIESQSSNSVSPLPSIAPTPSILKLGKSIILPAGVFKGDKPAPKFLTLPGGKVIRLVETKRPLVNPWSTKGGKTLVYASTSAKRAILPAIPSTTVHQLQIQKAIPNVVQPLENQVKETGSSPNPHNCLVPPVPSTETVSAIRTKMREMQCTSLRCRQESDMPPSTVETVLTSDSTEVQFHRQPGPKKKTSYSCVVCGKRNLSEASIKDHAEGHSLKAAETVSID